MNDRLLNGRRLQLWLGAILTTAGALGCGARIDPDDGPGTPDGSVGIDKPAGCATTTPDSGYRCSSWSVTVVSGDRTECGFDSTGYKSGSGCSVICGSGADYCSWSEGSGSGPRISCSQMTGCAVDGRRPEGVEPFGPTEDGLGGWFARMAFYEAASIDAFAILEQELRAHDAPRALIRAAARARRDEIVHRDLAAALAERFGASDVRLPRALPRATVRSLLDMALDNAREGCARETLGVAVGLHQAEHAADPAVRAFYARIARDESRHAALSWRLHRWLCERLAPEERSAVARAVRDALRSMVIPALPTEALHALGMPSTDVVRDVAGTLARAA